MDERQLGRCESATRPGNLQHKRDLADTNHMLQNVHPSYCYVIHVTAYLRTNRHVSLGRRLWETDFITFGSRAGG